MELASILIPSSSAPGNNKPAQGGQAPAAGFARAYYANDFLRSSHLPVSDPTRRSGNDVPSTLMMASVRYGCLKINK